MNLCDTNSAIASIQKLFTDYAAANTHHSRLTCLTRIESFVESAIVPDQSANACATLESSTRPVVEYLTTQLLARSAETVNSHSKYRLISLLSALPLVNLSAGFKRMVYEVGFNKSQAYCTRTTGDPKHCTADRPLSRPACSANRDITPISGTDVHLEPFHGEILKLLADNSSELFERTVSILEKLYDPSISLIENGK